MLYQKDTKGNKAYYKFVVIAKDKGNPPLEGTTMVRVHTNNLYDQDSLKVKATKIMVASREETEIVDLEYEEPYCDYMFKGVEVCTGLPYLFFFSRCSDEPGESVEISSLSTISEMSQIF